MRMSDSIVGVGVDEPGLMMVGIITPVIMLPMDVRVGMVMPVITVMPVIMAMPVIVVMIVMGQHGNGA